MKLNGIFKDNMVFQAGRKIRVFGICDPGDAISVKLIDQGLIISESSCNSNDGSFLVELPPRDYGGPYSVRIFSGNSEPVILNNIYIGEVWLAGGQSNMEYPLGRSDNAKDVIASCPATNIHFYKVPVTDKYDADTEDGSSWVLIDNETCYDMSAIAFYFARILEEHLEDAHIGIIGCYLGGTSISCWQSRSSLERTSEGRVFIDEYELKCRNRSSSEEYIEAEKEYAASVEEYENRVKEALSIDPFMTYLEADQRVGAGPWPPPVTPLSIRHPGSFFDGMVSRISPFSIRGVIFYQGEEDSAEHSSEYAVVFRTLIEEWRDVFMDEYLPFIFCKLPEFIEGDMNWDSLQRQQEIVADTVPGVYMADLKGLGEIGNVHPSDKRSPGLMLVDIALKNIY